MKQFLLVFVASLGLAAALVGCGGQNSDHIIGIQDPRVLGDWVATKITFDGTSGDCPTTIIKGDPGDEDSVSCTTDISHFSEDGHLTSAGVTTDVFVSADDVLTVYTSPVVTIQLTFENDGTRMHYIFTQNGRDVDIQFDRPV